MSEDGAEACLSAGLSASSEARPQNIRAARGLRRSLVSARRLLRIDGRWLTERRKRPSKALLQVNTGGICPKSNAAGALRRPPGALRFYAQQASRHVTCCIFLWCGVSCVAMDGRRLS